MLEHLIIASQGMASKSRGRQRCTAVFGNGHDRNSCFLLYTKEELIGSEILQLTEIVLNRMLSRWMCEISESVETRINGSFKR